MSNFQYILKDQATRIDKLVNDIDLNDNEMKQQLNEWEEGIEDLEQEKYSIMKHSVPGE